MRYLAFATLTAAATLVAAPSFAQPLDELTVTGHAPGARPMSLSETVSYADLDLTQHADRERLEWRVNNAARRICTQLNEEGPNHNNLGKSCQDVAVRGAMDQVRTAFADASSAPAYANAYGAPVSATVRDPAAYGAVPYDNGPIPDTPENRARYGAPLSRAGQRTVPNSNN